MCIRTNIHGSVAFPIQLPIDKENPYHNITFQSVLYIHGEWAVIGDDVTGTKYSNDSVIYVKCGNKLYWNFYATYLLEHVEI